MTPPPVMAGPSVAAFRVRCRGPRLRVAPLLDALNLTDVVTRHGQFRSRCSHMLQAEALGVAPRQLDRWKRDGVTWVQADELAVRIGQHPGTVWGRDWWSLEGC